MTDGLDMSLEDIIKKNKKGGVGNSSASGRGGRSGSNPGPGPTRRFQNRGSNRTTPYSMGKPVHAPETAWQHDMFIDPVGAVAVVAAQGGGGGGGRGIETGTKLYISNLDYGVSNEDIKELFSEVGDLKRYSVHYDRSGRSKGTAEVVFSRRSDAAAAVKRYNNVQLDGKPMKIEIVGTNIVTPGALPIAPNGVFGNPNFAPRGGQGRVRATTRLRGGGGGFGGGSHGAGRGRGRGRGRSDPVSAKDLDAELDKYHSEAMQIN
ncbi:hypothetical protein IFM89_008870 [Coptis chinensis]|uniref:RRM domain-containing protein n=1 Tax=Coptis chinensis TaxID=261450 RepID=A0A835HD97_9MAGN|nr:hypothetical protein IFM89_008870 [Coptis chinensis]